MYEVIITGVFAAAHQLRLPSGALEPLHGHNWQVRAIFAGPELDQMGVLVDFTVIRPRVLEVLARLNDTYLNELSAFAECNPSAEHVARHIAEEIGEFGRPAARLISVEVEEEPGCFARYAPE
jgi:6-pyruvoyltetrahydropterin/6-carboxytetrahydropterin synthase